MAKEKKEIESKGKLQDTLDLLNKKYGVGTVSMLDHKTTGEYDVISSGSIGFDYVTLGVGGWVKGKLYEIMGWEGSGKSTACGHAAAECQKKGGVVAYIDGEHALDKKYFQALGVDTSKMLISQPSCGEEGFNVAIDLIKTGKIDLLIIDSDSSLIPKKVLDGEVGDSSIGLKARLNSAVYPKLKSALSENNTCVIVVSQYREKIGVMFGCLHGETLINFTDGRSIPIRKVVDNKIQGKVYSVCEDNGQIEEKEILDWHHNGKVDTVNDYIHIETSGLDGQNTIGITVTPDHKIATSLCWKAAKDLTLSDRLLSRYKSQINGSLANFFYGTFVGDCSILKRDKTTANIRFQDKNNPEYLQWKINKLSNCIGFSNSDEVYHSSYTSEFKLIKDRYPKRDTEAFFDNYSNLGLAIWFMDDVHFDNTKGHCRYILSVKRFKNIDKYQQICNRFNEGLNTNCTFSKSGQIIFNVKDTLTIAEIICKYVPNCMQYKLPEQFRNKYEEFSLSCELRLETSYVKINSTRYASNKQMHNRGKYDLTVEGNSNYFAGGILNGVVVHNSPTTTQGGHALKFYSDCRIEISKTVAKDGEETAIGNKTKVKCTKNKMAPPYRTSEFIIIYGVGIDTFEEFVRLAVDFDIIGKSGSWFNYGETKLGQGINSVTAILSDNPELYEEIQQKLINKLKNTEDGIQPVSEVSEDNSNLPGEC